MDLSVTNDAAEKGVKNAQEAALSSKSESRRESALCLFRTCKELNVLHTTEIICQIDIVSVSLLI